MNDRHIRITSPKRKFEPVRLIGLLVLVVLLFNVDLARLWALLTGLTLRQIVLAGAAVLALLLARCERWHSLLLAAGIAFGRRQTYRSCLSSIWLGYITPGRVGEFKRGLDLAKWHALPSSAATALVLLDIGADALVAIAIVIIALLAAFATATHVITFDGGFWVGLTIVIGATFVTRPALSLAVYLSSKISYLVNVTEMLKRLASAPYATLFCLLWLTLVIEGLYVAMMIPLLAPIDPAITLSNATVIVMVATVTGFVPVTYFGLGTREASMLLLLAGTGRSSETVVALSLTFVAAQAIGLVVAIAADTLFRAVSFMRHAAKET